MTPSEHPAEIEYERWRSKAKDYEVKVLEVRHRHGASGFMSLVIVRGSQRDPDKRVSWPAETFLRLFEPLGEKLKIPTRYERLRA